MNAARPPYPSIFRRIATALIQWIDSDYCPEGPEKMRAALLSQLGLTEEKVKAMSPEEQQKVEQKIRDLIKQAAEKHMDKTGQGGFITDVKV